MNVTQSKRPKPVMSERRVSIIGALLVAIGPISMSLYTPAMPEIVNAFGTTEALVKLSLSVYFAGFAGAQLLCGPLSDGLGRRPVTVGFMIIYTFASLIALFAPSIEVLIASRFLQGVGGAVGIAMSRAIVRDLFTHEQSSRVMNLIGIILAVAPAAAPTIGGLTMEFFGWHAVFLLMALFGIIIALIAIFAMKETVLADLSRLKPRELLRSYASLLNSRYFVTSSLINAGASGALYAQATVLPFILMERVGLTPAQFGAGMLFQSLSFLSGSVAMRSLIPRFGAFRLVPVGLIMIGAGSLGTAVLPYVVEPTFLSIMIPVGVYAFGIAFVSPGMSTAAMAPFPKNAGAAAAMMGFMQMGAGLVGGLAMALIADPLTGMATIVPLLGLMSIVSWLVWRRLREPVVAVAPSAAVNLPIDP